MKTFKIWIYTLTRWVKLSFITWIMFIYGGGGGLILIALHYLAFWWKKKVSYFSFSGLQSFLCILAWCLNPIQSNPEINHSSSSVVIFSCIESGLYVIIDGYVWYQKQWYSGRKKLQPLQLAEHLLKLLCMYLTIFCYLINGLVINGKFIWLYVLLALLRSIGRHRKGNY